jgi:hypothetical protein
MAVELQLVFQRGDDEVTDQIPSIIDDMPKLGDRFTYDGRRWQVRSVEEVDYADGMQVTYVYLTYEDAPPRA